MLDVCLKVDKRDRTRNLRDVVSCCTLLNAVDRSSGQNLPTMSHVS